jgi:hypothetical protein
MTNSVGLSAIGFRLSVIADERVGADSASFCITTAASCARGMWASKW